jgi:GGDEF domain-containing protein
LILDGETLGTLTLYDEPTRSFTHEERGLAVSAAGYVAGAVRGSCRAGVGAASLSDPLTGLPNARFLWLEMSHRVSWPGDRSDAFGLLAFRACGLAELSECRGVACSERLLVQLARRLAAQCLEGETLARFGQDLFAVLCATHRQDELVERWNTLIRRVGDEPFDLGVEAPATVRLQAAHAAYPADGRDLEALLVQLESRLRVAGDVQRTVVPFRNSRRAHLA